LLDIEEKTSKIVETSTVIIGSGHKKGYLSKIYSYSEYCMSKHFVFGKTALKSLNIIFL
jgi:hypothetical protein